jgi:hypothetical protein
VTGSPLTIELLKDESSEIDLVGPTLPALKTMLEFPVSAADTKEKYRRLVHGLLSACLLNVDAMRLVGLLLSDITKRLSDLLPSGRQGLISAKKIKNNLLAAVLILTVIPSSIEVGLPVIEHCCFLISQKLLDSDEVRPVFSSLGHSFEIS